MAGATVAVRPSDQGGSDLRAIDCPCGHRLVGADDDELFDPAREHVLNHHPDMVRSDEQLRARVAADAYDVRP